MLFTCLYIWDPENLQPWAPFGAAGAVRASPTAFFAFLGFEEASNNVSTRVTSTAESCDVTYTRMCLTRGAKLILIVIYS